MREIVLTAIAGAALITGSTIAGQLPGTLPVEGLHASTLASHQLPTSFGEATAAFSFDLSTGLAGEFREAPLFANVNAGLQLPVAGALAYFAAPGEGGIGVIVVPSIDSFGAPMEFIGPPGGSFPAGGNVGDPTSMMDWGTADHNDVPLAHMPLPAPVLLGLVGLMLVPVIRRRLGGTS